MGQPRTRKKRKRVVDPQSNDEVQSVVPWLPPKLPWEVLAHVLQFFDAHSTLIAASRACRSLQHEADRILYREVTLHRISHLRSLRRALNRVQRRARLIEIVKIDDYGSLADRTAEINKVLPMLTSLRHLKLKLGLFGIRASRYLDVLRTLSKCAFSLETFEGLYFPGDHYRVLQTAPGHNSSRYQYAKLC